MHQTLEDIVRKTRQDLEERKRTMSLDALKASIAPRDARPFAVALRHPKRSLAVIAETKLASPSAGVLSGGDDFISRLQAYESAAADALSIVTERHFFHGSPELVRRAHEAVSLPILEKDFILDSYQLYEAKRDCADAILLIARIVSGEALRYLVAEARAAGLEPVVEIHSEEELERAIESKPSIIAVNARDLDTFTVDIGRACRLLKAVPDSFVRLGFSGVQTSVDAGLYRAAGANGVLIGTALMQAPDINVFLKNLI